MGRHGDVCGDPERVPYSLVDADLSSEGALALASRGARVVYDACGCGGAECKLDWLSEAAVRDLARSGVGPEKHATKDGHADLEHWRSQSGQDLVVVAVEVSWGDRIQG